MGVEKLIKQLEMKRKITDDNETKVWADNFQSKNEINDALQKQMAEQWAIIDEALSNLMLLQEAHNDNRLSQISGKRRMLIQL
jgi:hypothetical protein